MVVGTVWTQSAQCMWIAEIVLAVAGKVKLASGTFNCILALCISSASFGTYTTLSLKQIPPPALIYVWHA